MFQSFRVSMHAVVNNIVDNLLEAMNSILLIRRDDFQSLLNYLETLERKCKIFLEAGFEVANKNFCDAFALELVNYF